MIVSNESYILSKLSRTSGSVEELTLATQQAEQ